MAMDANGTQYLQALADTDPDYRTEIWSVGALAGVDTGSLTNCTVDRSRRRGAEAKVTAVLTFSSKTPGDEPGGRHLVQRRTPRHRRLVGFAMPETGAKLTGLTLDQNVTVAASSRMRTPPTTAVRIPAPAPIQQKKHAITPSPTKTRARPSGAPWAWAAWPVYWTPPT